MVGFLVDDVNTQQVDSLNRHHLNIRDNDHRRRMPPAKKPRIQKNAQEYMATCQVPEKSFVGPAPERLLRSDGPAKPLEAEKTNDDFSSSTRSKTELDPGKTAQSRNLYRIVFCFSNSGSSSSNILVILVPKLQLGNAHSGSSASRTRSSHSCPVRPLQRDIY